MRRPCASYYPARPTFYLSFRSSRLVACRSPLAFYSSSPILTLLTGVPLNQYTLEFCHACLITDTASRA